MRFLTTPPAYASTANSASRPDGVRRAVRSASLSSCTSSSRWTRSGSLTGSVSSQRRAGRVSARGPLGGSRKLIIGAVAWFRRVASHPPAARPAGLPAGGRPWPAPESATVRCAAVTRHGSAGRPVAFVRAITTPRSSRKPAGRAIAPENSWHASCMVPAVIHSLHLANPIPRSRAIGKPAAQRNEGFRTTCAAQLSLRW